MTIQAIILEAIHDDGVRAMEAFCHVDMALGLSRDEQLRAVSDADVVIVKSVTQVDAAFFDSTPKLKIVARAGTGLENIDREEAARRGIAVLNVPTGNTVSAAEFTILQILSLCRRQKEIMIAIAHHDFRRQLYEGRELQTMRIGLIGLGNVGINVAERLVAFGCQVLAWDPTSRHLERFRAIGGEVAESIQDLLAQVDVLSLHAALTPQSKNLLGAREFGWMKPGMLLVNSARAQLIDDEALLAAIESGRVAAVALDVLSPEPPFDTAPEEHNYTHALLDHPRVTVTPHIGASTVDAQKRIALDLARQVEETLITMTNK